MTNSALLTDYNVHITDHRSSVTPKVSIIILNWNGWKDTIECLESLNQISYPDYDVIIVDNGSEDGSIEKIKEYAEGQIEVRSKFFEYSSENKPIKIIEYEREEAEAGGGKEGEIRALPSNRKLIIIKNEKNYGFAGGNNIGIQYALKTFNPGYVLLLNNDTAVDSAFLGELVKVAESDARIGIVGPIIYHYNAQRKIHNTGVKICWNKGRGHLLRANEIDNGQFNEIVEVDYVQGCALLAKRELFDKIGYLNPNYIIYVEETEWCVRAHKAGYKVLCVPNAKMWHKGSSTTKEISGFYEYLITRNRFWFMKQHATKRQYILFLANFFGFRFWVTGGALLIYHKNINAFISFCKGTRDGIAKSGE